MYLSSSTVTPTNIAPRNSLMSWIHVLSAEELETKRIDDANAVDLAQQSKAMRTRSLLVVEPNEKRK